MKKMNKKGFTIVELVIVIAVIGILAAVLIPTFSSVIDKANASKAYQEAKNEYTVYVAEYAETLNGDEDFIIIAGDYYVIVTDGQLAASAIKGSKPATGYESLDVSRFVKTADTTVTDNKDYYDATGTKVDSPDNGNIKTYYELSELGNANVAIYAKSAANG